MAKLPATREEIEEFFGRFSKETDRGCGVLGPAYLDELLKALFQTRHGNAGPHNFGARIRTAYLLAWISDHTYADLEEVREVRNQFAHSFDHELCFDDQSIAQHCQKLQSTKAFLDGFAECARNNPNFSPAAIDEMRNAFTTPRWRFQIAVEIIAQLLSTLPAAGVAVYAGPDLLKEAYSASANLRLEFRAAGYAPPVSPPS